MTLPAHLNLEPTPLARPSPKRKRTTSQSEMLRGFKPEIQLSQNRPSQNPEDAQQPTSELVVKNLPQFIFPTRNLGNEGVNRKETEGEARWRDVSVKGDVTGEMEGASSPRTIVAKRFGEMELKNEMSSLIPVLKFGGSGEKERKKARLEGFEDIAANSDTFGAERAGSWQNQHRALTIRDVGSSFRKEPLSEGVEIPDSPQPPAPSSHRGSPPPPIFQSSPSPSSPTTSTSASKSSSQHPTKDSNKDSPLSDLTWQDSEITGHLALDPDDDGYGINGIGFRPTPAMAYARSQRRRQQVLEWKNRESREARSRRAEERRAGRRGGAGIKGRVVRFAGEN